MPPLCEELNCLCDVEPLGLPGKESLKVLSHGHRGQEMTERPEGELMRSAF